MWKGRRERRGGKKKVEEEELEVVPSQNAMYLTLCQPLEETKYQDSLSCLSVCGEEDRYGDERLRFALVSLLASGVKRISHINHEPKESWGVLLDHSRRPDGDTLDRYLEALIELDEEERGGEAGVEERWGCIRERGRIAHAQQQSLRNWAEAGLLEDEVWRFDGHTIEYYGEGDIGKTKHGTKAKSVKAVDRYTLYNGICGLTDYFPTSISYDEALRRMLLKAQEALPEELRIRKLCFDKEGWKSETLLWLWEEHQVAPLVWVKNTPTNVKILNQIEEDAFVRVPEQLMIGKGEKCQIARMADTIVELPALGSSRVVVLETTQARRIAIYTAAPTPQDTILDNTHAISTIQVLEAMRLQQHVENSFKVDVHEMGADALPMHKLLTVQQAEPYPLDGAQKQLDAAQNRFEKYSRQLQEHIPDVEEHSQLEKNDINLLNKRAARLQQEALDKIERLSHEIESTIIDEQGQSLLLYTKQFLDLRKLTLFNLFKAHAQVALIMLAQILGWNGAGPQRLRQTFLAFGHRVEFDHHLRIATVFPTEFPSATTQTAYECLCSQLHGLPLTLMRQGIEYQLRFQWDSSNTKM